MINNISQHSDNAGYGYVRRKSDAENVDPRARQSLVYFLGPATSQSFGGNYRSLWPQFPFNKVEIRTGSSQWLLCENQQGSSFPRVYNSG